MVNEKTFEYCPYCNFEVEIDADKPSKCPVCQELILPCSTCYEQFEYKGCDWTKENWCCRFPRKNYVK